MRKAACPHAIRKTFRTRNQCVTWSGLKGDRFRLLVGGRALGDLSHILCQYLDSDTVHYLTCAIWQILAQCFLWSAHSKCNCWCVMGGAGVTLYSKFLFFIRIIQYRITRKFFVGEKLLRMSQISRKVYPFCDLTIAFWQGLTIIIAQSCHNFTQYAVPSLV